MLWTMAWRNLWRHRRRTLLTAGALALSTAFVLALMAYMDGMYRTMASVMVEQSSGHIQVYAPLWPETRAAQYTLKGAEARLAAIAGLPGTRASSGRLFGYVLLGGTEKTAGAQLVGVEPARELLVTPLADRVVAGRFLAEAPGHEIVLGQGLARTLEVAVGGEVVAVTQSSDGSLGNELYHVVGVAAAGSSALDRGGAWVHLADLQALLVLPDQVHQVIILSPTREPRVGDPMVDAAAEAVRGVVGEGAQVSTWWEASPATAQMLGMSDISAWVMLTIVFGVAGLGVLNTMLMSVFERTRELGVMKALGARPGRIVRLVLAESVWLGALSLGGGLVLGGVLDSLLVTHGLPMTVNGERLSSAGVLFDPVIHGVVRPERIAVTVAFLGGVALLAALWPALRAAGLRPVDAMRDR